MKDYIVRAIDETGNIRILVSRTSNLVEKARRIHNTSATGSAALGRSLTAGVMMGNMLKNKGDILTITINGKGPGGIIDIVAKNDGRIKGYIQNPQVDMENREDGKLNVGGLVGRNGTITTIMDLGLKEPYVGTANLVSGEIAEDIANYYAVSEQQPSAVALGVLVDKDLSIKAAGGYIIQILPGAKEEDIIKIENSLKDIEETSVLIDRGMSPEEIAEYVLKGFNVKILEKYDIKYECDCSREKVEKALISLGRQELEEIIEEDEGAELVCHFCNNKYNFNKKDLENLLLTSSK